MKMNLLLKASFFSVLFSLVFSEVKADWKTYIYSQGKFEIDFPNAPASETDGDYKTLTSTDGKQVYRITFLTKDGYFDNPQEFIDHSFEMYGSIDGSIEKMENGSLKGQQAKVKDGANDFLIRVWMSDSRIWSLIVAKQNGKVDEKKAKIFFDSFVTTVASKSVAAASQNTANSSVSNTSSSSQTTDDSFDAMSYFKSKVFPHISNIKDLEGWGSYSDLDMFVRNDLSDIKEKIETYGEDYIKTSFAGREGLQFMNNYLTQVYPIFPQIIEKYLEGVPIKPTSKTEDFFKGEPRLLYLKKVADLAEDFKIVHPTAETKAVHKRAVETYNKAINAAPYVKGEYYKNNLGKVALFKEELAIGTATEEKESNILSPKNGKFLVAYFPNPLNSGQRYVGMKWRKKKGTTHIQKLFVWKKDEVEFLRNNGAIGFNVFPNPEKLNYKSGYQYDAHLNVLKFLLSLPNGTNELEIGFTRSKMANTTAEVGYNDFILEMNEATRSEIQAIYDKLLQKRIEVTMPFFCRDDRKMVSNPEGFEKYGKLLKFNHTGTPAEVKDADWPHPVIGYNTNGWAAVERPDGTVEIIPIGLFKAVGGTTWKFTSLNQIPSFFEMNSIPSSGRGEFGYLMKKENVAKCHDWE